MKEAIYAGDDYEVTPNGLSPYDPELEFLPWVNVDASQALVVPPIPRTRIAAAFPHPPGTSLHEDKPLRRMVDEHFERYGHTVKESKEQYEDIVRTAEPWNVSYGAGWYKQEAGHAVERLRRIGYTRHQAAHLIADLSPQNPWFGTPKHPDMGNREEAVRYGRECRRLRQHEGPYEEGKLTVTPENVERAHQLWGTNFRIREGNYDISSDNPRDWEIGSKELAELPQFHSRATRAVRSNAIATGLGIRHHDLLGPKTGPFHHNILDPYESPYTTIDTWMVDASGLHAPREDRAKFLASKEGARAHPIPTYKGLGQVGLASAIISATHSLNESKPKSLRGHQDLVPMHTQAIVWTEHQNRVNPKFKKAIEPLKTLPWDQVFGYNFGHPHT